MMILKDKIEKTYVYGDPSSPVAVATLASDYEKFRLKGYAILGSCFTENFGVQMAVVNMLKNPGIRYLILCGKESMHLAGDSFKSLHENGVSRYGLYKKVIGSKALIPFMNDIPDDAIDEYMENITLIDMIGVEDSGAIQAKIDWCVGEAQKTPCRRQPVNVEFPAIDENSWKKYNAIVESEMKRRIAR